MKKVLSVILAVVMIITIVPVSAIMASATVYTGTGGDGSTGNTVSYNLDSETGVLNIVGRGNMKDLLYYSNSRQMSNFFGILSNSSTMNLSALVTEIRIGSYVTSVGDYCFANIFDSNLSARFDNLNSINLGSSIKRIGKCAFYDVKGISSILIQGSCQTIDSSAFCNCTSLSTVIFGSGMQYFGTNAFYGCSVLNTPQFPASLKSIGKQCFYNCSSMTGDMVLYSNLATIGENAFYGTNLDSITIYNSDCEIFENATTIPMKTKIIGHIGSTAQAYADEFGNEFEAIEGETTEVVEPTCTEQGYTIHTCNDCGGTFKDTYTSALGHKEISAPAKAATCTEAGHKKGFICSVCGAVINGFEEIPATGHTEEVTKKAVAPTCTDTGLTEEITCSVCNEVLQEQTEVAALGHQYEEETIIEPTCTEAGLKKLTCSVCHESHTEDIPALNHHYVNHVVAPTCTKRGYTRAVCERCNNEFDFDFVEAIGEHSYQGIVTIAPTCTHAGYTTYTCADCGYSYIGDIVAMTEHSFIDTVTEPTTESQGYTVHTCKDCGYSYVDSITDILPSQMHYIIPSLADIQATVTIKSDENEYSVTAANGVFELDSIKGDVYRVYAKQKNSLTVCVGEYDTKSGGITNDSAIAFPLGDVNGDDVIDIADLSMLLASGNYGQDNDKIDLTGDNIITIDDIAVALQTQNYGKSSVSIV